MKKSFVTVLALGAAFTPATALFAQRGVGGIGLGGRTGVGLGAGNTTGPGSAVGSSSASAAGAARATGNAGSRTAASTGGRAAGSVNSAGATAAGRIADNAQLSSKIQSLLPAGESVSAAAAGFRNEGQFIAAAHVAQNLNIPFDQLKAKMTGPGAESLGHAVHDLKPAMGAADVKAAVRTADKQADQDMDAARVAAELSHNAVLASRVQAMLPAGETLQAAAAGFENAHQLLVAEHLAQNLRIPFSQVQSQVTASDSDSMALAIRTLEPGMSASAVRAALKTANQQASADLKAAGQTSASVDDGR